MGGGREGGEEEMGGGREGGEKEGVMEGGGEGENMLSTIYT